GRSAPVPGPRRRRAAQPRPSGAAARHAARPADPDGEGLPGAGGAAGAPGPSRRRPHRGDGAGGVRRGDGPAACGAPLPRVDGQARAGPVPRPGRAPRRSRGGGVGRRRGRRRGAPPRAGAARLRPPEGADLRRPARQAAGRASARLAGGRGSVRRGRRAAQRGGRDLTGDAARGAGLQVVGQEGSSSAGRSGV
ncbi:MAG: hypothetical protein AVDCRST_MAG16-3310, partial [uncultured Frankineae bacterium]